MNAFGVTESSDQADLEEWTQLCPSGCRTCCNLDLDRWYGGIPVRLSSLGASKQNCVFCDVLYQAVHCSGYPSEAWTPKSRIRVGGHSRYNDSENDCLKLAMLEDEGYYWPVVSTKWLEVFPIIEQTEWPFHGAKNSIPDSTGSEKTFTSIRKWLLDCDQNHISCDSSRESYLPRRVLAVDRPGDSVFLVETNADTSHETYACLSHCWGTRQPLTTTTSTIRERTEGIQWSDLPQTFQDAVRICRELAIPYLWIDSLCIMQDNDEDWAREAAMMATVYSNAYVTIAASASRDDSEGCFRATDCPTQSFTTTFLGGSEVTFHVRNAVGHFYPRPVVTLDTTSWPLMGRAWTFQERLLSPRVLHFGPSEVIWECQTTNMCECSGKIELAEHLINKIDWHSQLQSLSPNTIWQLWRNLVAEYSCRRLKFPRDIFPALAGATQHFHTHTSKTLNPGKCLAGLWSGDLFNQLLWVRTSESPDGDANSTHLRAPSWSWAAREGQAAFLIGDDFENLEKEAVILDCSCELLTTQTYSDVATGHLQLRAVVIRLDLQYHPSENIYCDVYLGYSLAEQKDDDTSVKSFSLDDVQLTPDYSVAQDYAKNGSSATGRLGEVYVVKMGTAIDVDGVTSKPLIYLALVLRKKQDQGCSDPVLFERIGIFFYKTKSPRSVENDPFVRGEEMFLDIV